MSYKKWISGAIGWAIAGPLGALLGYGLAALLESDGDGKRASVKELGGGERNSFLISLLVLSSAVMKADGKVMRSELDYVKKFLVKNFGVDAGAEATRHLRDLLKKEVNVAAVGAQISRHMPYEARVQLFHYLVGIALADGEVSSSELRVLNEIAVAIAIREGERISILAMFDKGVDAAYRVLEVTPESSDDEIKKAYRRLATLNHPDKVANLGIDIQNAAEEKFKKINEAYTIVKRERGIV